MVFRSPVVPSGSGSSRRRFLQSLALASAGAAITPRCLPGAVLTADDADPAMRFSICNETFAGWPHRRVCTFVAQLGYRGLEIAPFTVNTDVTQVSGRQRSQLRREAESAGIEIVALHWLLAKTQGLHLTSPDRQVRERTAEYLIQLARFCADLGGHVMVFGSPKQRNILPDVSEEDAYRYAAEVLRAALPELAKRDVILALEPLSPRTTTFLSTASQAVRLIEQLDSPHCRLLLDCLAMSTEEQAIPKLIRQFGRYLVHFHANDPNSLGPGMGKLDFVPIFRALREIDYAGWASVEVFNTKPGAEKIAEESLRYMQRVESQVAGATG